MKFNLYIILTILSVFGFNQTTSSQSLFSYENYVSENGDTLRYRQMLTDYAPDVKYPLVIFLHGSGERGDDNEAQLKWGVKNFANPSNMKMNPALVVAPQCPENMRWGNFSDDMKLQEEPTKPMKLLLELIEKTIENMPVDTNRVYITGLSMGGFGTFDAMARRPELFAAAVPVCGGGDPLTASQIAHIPTWIFHGAIDGAVDPSLSLNMLRALTEAGAAPGFTQYPEVGHFSWIGAYSDPMMMNWLFRQRRK